jgi:hypothetical protein
MIVVEELIQEHEVTGDATYYRNVYIDERAITY